MKNNQETILVVGASGFIGFSVCKLLIANGFIVHALDPFIRDDFPKEIKVYQGTTADANLVTRALTNCNRVIFLGGNSAPGAGVPTIASEITNELLPVIQFAEACANSGCKQFIFASSGGAVYGPSKARQIKEGHYCTPISSYGASKLSIESYLTVLARNTEMKTLSLRLSNPYGPGQVVKRNQGFVAAAMSAAFNQRPLPIWGDGSVTRDYLFIDDAAEAFVLSCKSKAMTDTINIGSGIGVSLLELCDVINAVTGKTLSIHFESARTVDISRNVVSTDLAKKKLNWSPKTSLQDGLYTTSQWWETL